MTDFYSAENYLVSEEVLVDLLKNEFHCHARPDIRASIVGIFRKLYLNFLTVTSEINFRIFLARKNGFRLIAPLPKKIGQIATVSLEEVTPSAESADAIVVFSEQLDASLTECYRSIFNSLDPSTRYRGKFALMFFLRWLDLLADDCASGQSRIFGSRSGNARVRRSEITLGNLATKSSFPKGLGEFIIGIAVRT